MKRAVPTGSVDTTLTTSACKTEANVAAVSLPKCLSLQE